MCNKLKHPNQLSLLMIEKRDQVGIGVSSSNDTATYLVYVRQQIRCQNLHFHW